MLNLTRKLLKKNEYNPFNDAFVPQRILQEIESLSESDLSENENKMVQTLLVAILLNSQLKPTFGILKETILDSGLSLHEIFNYCLAFVNRQILMLNTQVRNNKNEVRHFEDSFKIKVNSFDPTIGKIDAVLALEGNVDALNMLFSYINYFRSEIIKIRDVRTELHSIDSIKYLNILTPYFSILKYEYDNCIWNDGFAHFNVESERVDFYYEDSNDLILKKIGFFRLNRNIMNYFIYGKSLIDKGIITDFFKTNRKEKRIKKVTVENGFIKYKLAQSHDKAEFYWEFKNECEFLAYYAFIENVNLPNLSNLTLKDILKLFNILQHLFRKASEIPVNNFEVFKLDDFNKFAHKIMKSDLKEYLLNRTNYTLSQINSFLGLLTNKEGKRVNFWDYPFIGNKDYFIFPLMTIVDPFTLVLTDTWLEDGGFDLEKRGPYLEKYVKSVVQKGLLEKKYQFKLPNKSKFYLPNNIKIKEEIDLILNLKNICIVAELKCIKFPKEPREEHNTLERLKDGAEQVLRKSQFLRKNHKSFVEDIGDIDGKEIIPLVITNYPIFSGYNLKGVPVVDFSLLDSYIKSGKISNRKRTTLNGKVVDEEILSEHIFYKNEDEFNANFKNFVNKPPAIETIKKDIIISKNKISLDKMEFSIFVESAEFY